MAKRQHRELLLTLQDFRKTWGPPRSQRALAEYRSRSAIISLLSAFDDEGEIIAQLRTPPKYTPRYEGGRDDLIAQASFLYRNERVVTLLSLAQMRQGLGLSSDFGQMRSALVAARWCVDQSEWMPETEYYRVRCGPVTIVRLRWRCHRETVNKGSAQSLPPKQRDCSTDCSGDALCHRAGPPPAMGSAGSGANLDGLLFGPGCAGAGTTRALPDSCGTCGQGTRKRFATDSADGATGFFELRLRAVQGSRCAQRNRYRDGHRGVQQSAQTRARLGYEQKAIASFRSFLRENPADAEVVVDAYNRTFRGYIDRPIRAL